jgi:hypothetical protein
MIKEFVDKFMESRDVIRAHFKEKYPEEYEEIVREVVRAINPEEGYDTPDPTRIQRLDFGDYQGTLLFIIPNTAYQPDKFWFVKIAYGSCSGCDTLCDINQCLYDGDTPSKEQLDDYMTLALHIVQAIKELGGEEVY